MTYIIFIITIIIIINIIIFFFFFFFFLWPTTKVPQVLLMGFTKKRLLSITCVKENLRNFTWNVTVYSKIFNGHKIVAV